MHGGLACQESEIFEECGSGYYILFVVSVIDCPQIDELNELASKWGGVVTDLSDERRRCAQLRNAGLRKEAE